LDLLASEDFVAAYSARKNALRKLELEREAAAAASRMQDEPQETLISPLGLGFLAAELTLKQGMTLQQMAQRYCSYVRSACKGAHAELWAKQGPEWICLGTANGADGANYEQVLKIGKSAAKNAAGIFTAPVYCEGSLRGAVVVSRVRAGVDLDVGFVAAAAVFARGLVLTVDEREAAPVAA
jgi:hypothetical protein